MRLKDKVAIVTGAGDGIGKAIAHRFAKEGATVIIAARADNGKTVEEEITKAGGKALYIKTDVADSKTVQAMVDETIKQFNKIDILINNAGIFISGDTINTSEEDWDKIMNINLKGVFLCSKYVIPHMLKQKQGSIVHISSDWGLTAGRDHDAYCASKGAVCNLTRAMSLSYARKGIRVNAVCHGPIETKMLPKEAEKAIAESVPMGRNGKPEEVANVTLFLASEEASYITGVNYPIDGGCQAGQYVSEG